MNQSVGYIKKAVQMFWIKRKNGDSEAYLSFWVPELILAIGGKLAK